MRVLVDPDTSELVEVVPEAALGLTPYDYREAKAAHMRASRDRRKAEAEYEEAIRELAAAEKAYRIEVAKEVLRQKVENGATNAEALAKGQPHVAAARERYSLADGMRYVKLERIRGCDEDRKGIGQIVSWSRAVATGPWGDS